MSSAEDVALLRLLCLGGANVYAGLTMENVVAQMIFVSHLEPEERHIKNNMMWSMDQGASTCG